MRSCFVDNDGWVSYASAKNCLIYYSYVFTDRKKKANLGEKSSTALKRTVQSVYEVFLRCSVVSTIERAHFSVFKKVDCLSISYLQYFLARMSSLFESK